MNQFFSPKRFQLLVLKHWADNRKRYSLSVIAFIGLLITWFVFCLLVDSDTPMPEDLQQATFFFTLFLAGTFYASQYFRDLGSRAKGINFLLVPASAFEKLLCSVLYTVILFFIVFTATFYLVDFITVTLINTFYDNPSPAGKISVVNIFKTNREFPVEILLIFFSIQSMFLLGSVYFNKYGFIKTVISGFLLFFILFCLIYLLYDFLLPKGQYSGLFLNTFRVNVDSKTQHLVQLPAWTGHLLYFLAMYAIAPFLWVVTYYRLKEKQV